MQTCFTSNLIDYVNVILISQNTLSTHSCAPTHTAIFTQTVQTDDQLFLLASCITHNSFPIGKLISCIKLWPSENTERTITPEIILLAL